MIRQFLSIVSVVLALGGGTSVFAADASRGSLLYDTACVACHTDQAHWREKRLATDPVSLAAQVRHWAGVARLGWNEEEIQDVVLYLDAAFYRFPVR
ncbi:MAG: hypothetical protein R3E83_07740 [Burkholderiaceae bacterium]